jgi:L-alanine-DL-glutamate epimerase-like enolase superfamily enzyme
MIKQTGSGQHSSTSDTEQGTGAAVLLQLDAATAAMIDGWASSRQLSRLDAIHRLLALGLESAVPTRAAPRISTARAVELAASQIGPLIDPEAPSEERDRRIERLTKGPPEFVDARVDLPKRPR